MNQQTGPRTRSPLYKSDENGDGHVWTRTAGDCSDASAEFAPCPQRKCVTGEAQMRGHEFISLPIFGRYVKAVAVDCPDT